MNNVLKINEEDNAVVALTDLNAGDTVNVAGEDIVIQEKIAAKHKFAFVDLNAGDEVIMYGVLVGKTTQDIKRGGLLSTANIAHAASTYKVGDRKLDWNKPDTSNFQSKTFNGFHRADGSVGTANHWLVIPMVFCENRNVEVLQQALVDQLGYGKNNGYRKQANAIIDLYKRGTSVEEILNA